MGIPVEMRAFVDMDNTFNQDPQDWRRLRDVNHDTAHTFLERAKNDPDYEADFYAEKGYAAYAFLEILARPYRRARELGWTSVADGRRNAGDNSHTTADAIENIDSEGGASVRRTAPEA
ncbi:hypothetical protein OHB12_26515 [Nocardia sp. NBC_01730]|uniref:hypothetical protein n=1 Tax=Nocardia sp. NBC_01730 TaxID=2975998 RepID=UPI002E0E2FA0|nr:hypothetical protein OHB12_26515 [Nocardia sp. NBC_01730]